MKIEVDQYQLIRQLYSVEGVSIRGIARRLGLSRNTVRKYCQGNSVPWQRSTPVRESPVMSEQVKSFVAMCLKEDETAPKKQRHTAVRIYERLRKELGFVGGESTVRRYVRELEDKGAGVFIPLVFHPGEAAQVDWGEATFYLDGEKTVANLFCFRLCYSCAYYVAAFPRQKQEAFLEGHVSAFEHFGGVPQTVIYDNLKTAVKEGWGKTAKEHERFKPFAAHYAYTSRFCNPGEAHEKGLVENLVGYVRRHVFVPLPRVSSWEELNALLTERCLSYHENTLRDRDSSVREMLLLEKGQLTALPGLRYDTRLTTEAKADYYATVRFEGNRYSVPIKTAHKTVVVKGAAHTVSIYHHGKEIAVHERLYGKGRSAYRLEHYIDLLEERPRAVNNAQPVRAADIPEEIWNYAARLEDTDKAMVKLLRLVVDHGLDRLLAAVMSAKADNHYSLEVVKYHLSPPVTKIIQLDTAGPKVRTVELADYDLLLGGDR